MFKLVVMADPDRVETLKLGDTEIQYTRALGDEVQKLIAESVDPRTGQHDGQSVAAELMRRHIRGWSGVVDQEGNDYEFTEDRVATFFGLLGWEAQKALDRAVISSYREAVRGKGDSKSGSSGTG